MRSGSRLQVKQQEGAGYVKQRALSQRNALCIAEVWEWHSRSFNSRESTYGTGHIKGKVNCIAATLSLKNVTLFILNLKKQPQWV